MRTAVAVDAHQVAPGRFPPALSPRRSKAATRKKDNNNIRYSRIPQRVPRRNKALKLFHGNFVTDSAMPTKLLNLCAYEDERELMHMLYSNVHYDPPHRAELFIVVTMYNEDDTLFARTMHGVMKIIAYLCKRDRRETWGEDCWKRVIVFIINDGRRKINSRTLMAIAAFQERIATNGVNGKPVSVHIYEYFTQIVVTKPNKIEGAEMGIFLVQIIFCLKEKNEKINSHCWFFNAFGHILQLGFDMNSNVGDTCGEIVAFKGKYGQTLPNTLVASQNFECKMSDILDKLSYVDGNRIIAIV
ncbi:chitin synthase-domain-containing protein [Lactarius hatsudake]|nr:chitin synthase-domain-containing protein [Lactarius hatsudake]